MQAIVSLAGAFLTWTGQMVNMLKSKISAIDFANGQTVATDITSNSMGQLFLFNLLTRHSSS